MSRLCPHSDTTFPVYARAALESGRDQCLQEPIMFGVKALVFLSFFNKCWLKQPPPPLHPTLSFFKPVIFRAVTSLRGRLTASITTRRRKEEGRKSIADVLLLSVTLCRCLKVMQVALRTCWNLSVSPPPPPETNCDCDSINWPPPVREKKKKKREMPQIR